MRPALHTATNCALLLEPRCNIHKSVASAPGRPNSWRPTFQVRWERSPRKSDSPGKVPCRGRLKTLRQKPEGICSCSSAFSQVEKGSPLGFILPPVAWFACASVRPIQLQTLCIKQQRGYCKLQRRLWWGSKASAGFPLPGSSPRNVKHPRRSSNFSWREFDVNGTVGDRPSVFNASWPKK